MRKRRILLLSVSAIMVFSLSACKTNSDTDKSMPTDAATPENAVVDLDSSNKDDKSLSTNASEVKDIINIDISSFPEDNSFVRTYKSQEKEDLITWYIFSLTTIDIDPKTAESHIGTTRVITITYEDNSIKTYRILDNKFLKANDVEWKGVNHGEASQLDDIITNNPSD